MKKYYTPLIMALVFAALPARAALIHRYSFTTDASDSVGSAHGTNSVNTAQHPGATPVVYADGQVQMDGSGGYIQLPAGLVSKLTNVTIEIWTTWSGAAGDWQRLFDFGDTDSGGNGAYDMLMTPIYGGSGGKLRFAIANADPGYNNERDLSDPNQFPVATEAHVVLTYGPSGVRVFVNGVEEMSGPSYFPLSVLHDLKNYIGRSVYNDTPYNGSFNEFRIFDNLLTAQQIAASFLAGPDSTNNDPGAATSLGFTTVQNAMTEGDVQYPQLQGVFSVAGAVNLEASDVTLNSDKPNVITVENGALVAKGPGTANITASVGTAHSDPVAISVSPAVPVLAHRYSFNEARDATTVKDSAGGTTFDGNVFPDPDGTNLVTFTNGQAMFPGAAAFGVAPYIALPPGLFTVMTNVTIETWVTWKGANAGGGTTWQRVFDFGDSQKGDNPQFSGNGIDFLFLAPVGGAGVVRFDALPGAGLPETILDGPGALPVGKEVHVTAVYSPNRRLSKLYLDGVPVASGDASVPLSALSPDQNNWLGVSQWNDPPFFGAINELRIYEGVLSDVTIALSQTAGPETVPADPGVLKSIQLVVPNLYPGNPASVQAALLATFQNVSNVNIGGVSGVTFTAGDTNLFKVSATGGLTTSSNIGNSTLIASFQSMSATTTVSVVNPSQLTITNLPSSIAFDAAPVQLAGLARFPDATNVNISAFRGVTWGSSNPSVAVISATGLLTPISPGTATISNSYGGITATVQLAVVRRTGSQPAALVHRYSFNEASNATTVVDSVAGADGTLMINTDQFPAANPVVLTNGHAGLDGTGGYIELPPTMISVLSNVTFETWVSWGGGNDWQHLFEFGATDGGGAGSFDIFSTPVYGGSGGKFRFGISDADPGYNNEYDISDPNLFPRNAETHVVCIYAPTDGGSRVFINGALVASGNTPFPLSVVQDVNDYLGRSDYPDPAYNGSFNEFRIYDGAMTGAEIAASLAVGPNGTSGGGGPTLTATLSNGKVVLSWPATATGYTLETTSTLGTGAAWAASGAAITQANGNFNATIDGTAPAAFFRLRK
jgi:hypothetical protein